MFANINLNTDCNITNNNVTDNNQITPLMETTSNNGVNKLSRLHENDISTSLPNFTVSHIKIIYLIAKLTYEIYPLTSSLICLQYLSLSLAVNYLNSTLKISKTGYTFHELR